MQDELDSVYLHNLSYSESHPGNDVTTDSGFARAIYLVLSLQSSGTMVATPRSASWSPFTAKATGRDGRPRGKTSKRHVKQAHRTCKRLGLLLEIAHLRGCHFVVLTNQVSTMFEWEPFQRLRRVIALQNHRAGVPCQVRKMIWVRAIIDSAFVFESWSVGFSSQSHWPAEDLWSCDCCQVPAWVFLRAECDAGGVSA